MESLALKKQLKAMQRNFEALSKSHQSLAFKVAEAQKEVKVAEKMKIDVGEEREKLQNETFKVKEQANRQVGELTRQIKKIMEENDQLSSKVQQAQTLMSKRFAEVCCDGNVGTCPHRQAKKKEIGIQTSADLNFDGTNWSYGNLEMQHHTTTQMSAENAYKKRILDTDLSSSLEQHLFDRDENLQNLKRKDASVQVSFTLSAQMSKYVVDLEEKNQQIELEL